MMVCPFEMKKKGTEIVLRYYLCLVINELKIPHIFT